VVVEPWETKVPCTARAITTTRRMITLKYVTSPALEQTNPNSAYGYFKLDDDLCNEMHFQTFQVSSPSRYAYRLATGGGWNHIHLPFV